jgi:hypothetical protein
VLPTALLAWSAVARPGRAVLAPAAAAAVLSYLPRLLGVRRFRQPIAGALLHPAGVLALVAIQWYALGRALVGRPSTWKGRPYPTIRRRPVRDSHEPKRTARRYNSR